MKIHEKYIKRCIEIAKNGLGSTAPNPMVGCVIVHKDHIIGEGFTSPYGGPHAEVNAINSVTDKTVLENSTLYVTLEPCSHHGKTPPCSQFIIQHKIAQVVIGCLDSNPKVSGKGIKGLIAAGCVVVVGVLEEQCKKHHRRFFNYHDKKRPYIILKWAESRDGFIAPKTKNEQKPVWITNTASRQLVHKWRSEEQAILVGYNTVLADNPSLTTRDWKGQNPIRIVVDRNNALPQHLKVFDDKARTLVINEDTAASICKILFENDINSVIIEGGARTLQQFIDTDLWDEARVFTGDLTFDQGIPAPQLGKAEGEHYKILNDVLNIYYND